MACKEGQFDVVKLMVNHQFKTFSINLNTQHVNGMTPTRRKIGKNTCTVMLYSRVIRFVALCSCSHKIAWHY